MKKGSICLSAPLSLFLSQEQNYTEIFETNKGLLLNVILVTTDDGKIQEMDMMSLTNEFSNVLYIKCRDILKIPFDMDAHEATISAVYRKYRNDEELALATEITCSVE